MRNRAITLIAAALAALAAAAITTPAHAAVIRTAASVPVTISGRTATFTAHVNAAGVREGWHHVTILAPAGERLLEAGHGASKTADVVVRVTLATKYLTPGTQNELVVQDDVTGDWSTLPLDVRRRSRLTLTHAAPQTGGTLLVRGLLRHYSLEAGRFVPSRKSPIRVQQLVNGRWLTLADAATNPSGMVGVAVRPLPGHVVLRLSRPTGATVTATTSARLVVVS
jgi:methionine-rich copper-binding protein CopC